MRCHVLIDERKQRADAREVLLGGRSHSNSGYHSCLVGDDVRKTATTARMRR